MNFVRELIFTVHLNILIMLYSLDMVSLNNIWKKRNPHLPAPWKAVWSVPVQCIDAAEWFTRWMEDPRTNIPIFKRATKRHALFQSMHIRYKDGHACYAYFEMGSPKRGEFYSGTLKPSDFDPPRRDTLDVARSTLRKISVAPGQVAANPQGSLPPSTASLILHSGAVNFSKENFAALTSKDTVASNGGHAIARFRADNNLAKALSMIAEIQPRYVIDVGAKYGVTPKLLDKLGVQCEYLPVRPAGSVGSYDAQYHSQHRRLYEVERYQNVRTLPLQTTEVQKAVWLRDMTPENTVMLMSDVHYYLADYKLPFPAIVCGMQFSELQGFYTMHGREGYIRIFDNDGIKWVRMSVNRNPTVYSHPLIRVNMHPVCVDQLALLDVYRYCVWSLPAGCSPFQKIVAGPDHAIDFSMALATQDDKSKLVPFTSEYLALTRTHNVSPYGSISHGWDWQSFSWIEPEFSLTAYIRARKVLLIGLVCVSLIKIWGRFSWTGYAFSLCTDAIVIRLGYGYVPSLVCSRRLTATYGFLIICALYAFALVPLGLVYIGYGEYFFVFSLVASCIFGVFRLTSE